MWCGNVCEQRVLLFQGLEPQIQEGVVHIVVMNLMELYIQWLEDIRISMVVYMIAWADLKCSEYR